LGYFLFIAARGKISIYAFYSAEALRFKMSQSLASNVDYSIGDRRPGIIISVSVCMALAALSVIGRLVSRKMKGAKLSASDFWVIGGLAGAWVISLIIIEEAKLGLGRHIELVPFPNVREILLTTYIGEIFYSTTFPMIKISILLLYRSLFPGKRMVLATNIVGLFVILWGLSLLLVSIFSCNPIHGFWDLEVESKCVNSKWFFVGNSIPNILADIVILCLPMRDLWHLNMSTRSKVAVSGMFLLGSFVVVSSALRIYFMLTMNLMDMTWTYVGVGLWTAVEIDVAVISACLPTLRPVLGYLIPSFFREIIPGTAKDKSSNILSNNFSAHGGTNWSHGEEFQRLPEYAMVSVNRESD